MAAALFQKMNWKGQEEILVIQAPESFEPEIAALGGVRVVRDPSTVKTVSLATPATSRCGR